MAGQKVTQDDIGQAVDQDQTTVGKWLNGKFVPGGDVLVRLADFFEVSVDWLLGRTSDRHEGYVPPEDRGLATQRVVAELNETLNTATDAVRALNSKLDAARKSLAKTGGAKGLSETPKHER